MRLIARAWPEPTGLAQHWAPVVARLLALAAVLGLAMFAGSELVGRAWWFEAGLTLYIGLVVGGGIVSALGFDMMSHLGRQSRADSPAVPRTGTEREAGLRAGTEPSAGRAIFGPLAAVVAVHLAFALAISLLVVAAELAAGDSPDLSLIPTALFVTALGGSFAWLLGTLTTLLVIWPVIHLLRRLLPKRWQRDEDDSVTAGSVFLLLTVLSAIAGTIATVGHDVGSGTSFGQGRARILLVWSDLGDEPWRVTAVWIARGTLIALVVAGVHWARTVRRHRDP